MGLNLEYFFKKNRDVSESSHGRKIVVLILSKLSGDLIWVREILIFLKSQILTLGVYLGNGFSLLKVCIICIIRSCAGKRSVLGCDYLTHALIKCETIVILLLRSGN